MERIVFKNVCWFILVVVFVFLVPHPSRAAVRFSEIAWMGSSPVYATSSYAEWIELYNDASSTADVTGWKIFKANGATQLIQLSGSIGAQGYYVVGRKTASVPDPLPGVSDYVNSFGGSRLSNSGEYLTLQNSTGATVDSLDNSGGWVGGSSTTTPKQTMQLSGGQWITAAPTPRAANATITGDTSDNTGNDTSTTTTQQSSSNTGLTQSSGISTTLSSHENPAELSSLDDTPTLLEIAAGRNRLAFAGTPMHFTARSVLGKIDTTSATQFVWTFGDGGIATSTNPDHMYLFSGDYQIVVNAVAGANQSVDRLLVKVEDPKFVLQIGSVGTAGFVEIENKGDREINIGRAQLRVLDRAFVFPPDTIIARHASVRFGNYITGLAATSSAELVWHDGHVVARFDSTPVVVVPTAGVAEPVAAVPTEPTQLDSPVSEQVPEHPVAVAYHASIVSRPTLAVAALAATSDATTTVTIIPQRESLLSRVAHLPSVAVARLYGLFFNVK